jgi:hypothetical protein
MASRSRGFIVESAVRVRLLGLRIGRNVTADEEIDRYAVRVVPALVLQAVYDFLELALQFGRLGPGDSEIRHEQHRLLLQYLPAQAAMLTLAAAQAAGLAYCSARRELRQARWPG